MAPVGYPDWQPITAWQPRLILSDQAVAFTDAINIGPYDLRQAPGALVSVGVNTPGARVGLYPVTPTDLWLPQGFVFETYGPDVMAWIPNLTGRLGINLQAIPSGDRTCFVTLTESNIGGPPRVLPLFDRSINSVTGVPPGGSVSTFLDPPNVGRGVVSASINAGMFEGQLYIEAVPRNVVLLSVFGRAGHTLTWDVELPPRRVVWKVWNRHTFAADIAIEMVALGIT
jgi:hypothetical protein